MDIEKAGHLNLIAFALVFLLALTYLANQFVKDMAISFSVGIITMSLITIFCLFREVIGVSVLIFAIIFGLMTMMLGDAATGLFISSLLIGLFVLFTVMTR